MRALIGLLALVPVAILMGVLLRGRVQARVKSRRASQEQIENLLQESSDIQERQTIRQLERELDAARAREAKKQS